MDVSASKTHYDAIVIGAGVIGASITLALARRGWHVLAVDKLPTCGYGSTASSSAIVQPLASTPERVTMVCAGYRTWCNWRDFIGGDDVDERGLATFTRCGSLAIASDADSALSTTRETLDQLQVPCIDLDANELRERFPLLSVDAFGPPKRRDYKHFGVANETPLKGAVWFADAGFVDDPQLATHNVTRAAERAGAEFLYGERVVDVECSADRVSGVTLGNGAVLNAAVVVNAAGPHSAQVNKIAGVEGDMKVSTRALRQEVALVPMPDRWRDVSPFIVSDADTGVYMSLGNNGPLLIGSEDPVVDRKEWVDPDHFDPYLSDRWRTQVERACLRIPDLEVPRQLRGLVELYDVSDDWEPIYDKTALPGFYLAAGTSGHQFKSAPVAGELVAQIIEYVESGNDHDNCPLQFSFDDSDQSIDTGVFSRRRDVSEVSRFTVVK